MAGHGCRRTDGAWRGSEVAGHGFRITENPCGWEGGRGAWAIRSGEALSRYCVGSVSRTILAGMSHDGAAVEGTAGMWHASVSRTIHASGGGGCGGGVRVMGLYVSLTIGEGRGVAGA